MREIIQKNKSCETKYPILLVHGVFFRDSTRINYWGRIPKELEKNGAKIYYGNHQSADSVKKSGEEIAERISDGIPDQAGVPPAEGDLAVCVCHSLFRRICE